MNVKARMNKVGQDPTTQSILALQYGAKIDHTMIKDLGFEFPDATEEFSYVLIKQAMEHVNEYNLIFGQYGFTNLENVSFSSSGKGC